MWYEATLPSQRDLDSLSSGAAVSGSGLWGANQLTSAVLWATTNIEMRNDHGEHETLR
jgi:hypothetical protein